MIKKCIYAFILLFLVGTLYANEGASKKRDIVLFVDVSHSMSRVFPDVKEYLLNDFAKNITIGEKLMIVKFYGETENVFDKKIESADDIAEATTVLKRLRPNRPWTNIGTALDYAKEIFNIRNDSAFRKYMLLITDSRQEVKKNVKYYSKDFTIKHELIDKAKVENKKGWNVYNLFIEQEQIPPTVAETKAPEIKPDTTQTESKSFDWSWLWWVLIIIVTIVLIYLFVRFVLPFIIGIFSKSSSEALTPPLTTPPAVINNVVKGGSYKDVRDANIGGQVHHMPANSTNSLLYNNGPALYMDTEDHKMTASFGSSKSAKIYRQKQEDLIKNKKFDEALQMDIDDIKKKFGDKYNEGINDLLQYRKTLII